MPTPKFTTRFEVGSEAHRRYVAGEPRRFLSGWRTIWTETMPLGLCRPPLRGKGYPRPLAVRGSAVLQSAIAAPWDGWNVSDCGMEPGEPTVEFIVEILCDGRPFGSSRRVRYFDPKDEAGARAFLVQCTRETAKRFAKKYQSEEW